MQRQGESREAAPLARSHPANGGFILPHLRSPPGRRSHPDTPGTFFALGGGSAEAVAGSKFRVGGETQGGLFSVLGGLAGVRQGQGDAV